MQLPRWLVTDLPPMSSHPCSRFTAWSLPLLIVLLAAPFASAQKKPKENAEVLVGIRVAGMDVPTTGILYFKLWEVGQPPIVDHAWASNAGVGNLTKKVVDPVLMKPNRHYQATLAADPWSYGEVKFSAPPGYSIWINDAPVSTFRVLGNPFLIYKIELRSDQDAHSLRAGDALPPQVGNLLWSISAGRYSNGLSAGAVQWRAAGLSADLLDPLSLSYLEPSTLEVEVQRHSDGALLEIATYQMVLYVRRNSTPGTGYDIEIYEPYVTRSGSGDGPYTYSEAPYRTYRISDPDGGAWNNTIRIEKIDTNITESWTLAQSGSNWSLVQTNGLRTIELTSTGSTPRVETVTVMVNASSIASKLQRSYQWFSEWNQEELVQEIANPDATNGPALTTTYDYHTASGGNLGRLKSMKRSDGYWETYKYDDTFEGFGNLTTIRRPWGPYDEAPGNTPTEPASASDGNSQSTVFSYVGERNVFKELIERTESKVLTTKTGETKLTYGFTTAPNGQPVRIETIENFTGSGAPLTTARHIYNPSSASPYFIGRTRWQRNPDGTKVSHLRYKGYFFNYGDNNATLLVKWDPPVNNTWGEYRFSGFDDPAVENAQLVNLWDNEPIDPVYMVPRRSTIQLDIYDAEGRVGYRVDYVFVSASGGVPTFEFVGMESIGYQQGIESSRALETGRIETKAIANGRVIYDVPFDGASIYFDYNAIGQVTSAQRTSMDAAGEYPLQNQIYTSYAYDAAGRVIMQKLTTDPNPGNNPSEAVTTRRVYNPAGLLFTETEESDGSGGAYVTTYTYTNGGRTVEATKPANVTKIVTRWSDGSLKSVLGTAEVQKHRQVAVNGDGTLTTTTYLLRSTDVATPTAAPRWSSVTTDWIGRTIKEERPAPTGTFVRTFDYNSKGQLISISEPDIAPTLTVYNDRGEPYRTGLDVTPGGGLDPSSMDRITETDVIYEKDSNSAWWLVTTTKVYNKDSNGSAIPHGIVKQRLNKYAPLSSDLRSETIIIDAFGNQTRKTVRIDRPNRLLTETTDYPDSSVDEVVVTRNSLPQKRQTKEGLVYRNYYDGRGRPIKTTDPRTDTSSTPRIAYRDNSDRVQWRQDTAGNQTSYVYGTSTGRLYSEKNALGKFSYFEYNERGQIKRQWGHVPNPVEYGFNDYGEQDSLSTFRADAGWTGGTWPQSPGTADTTTFVYAPATGLLTSKTAGGKTVSYTYTARGQIDRRTWTRGVVTDYDYDSRTGELVKVDYQNDGGLTPDLDYTYDRLGQLKSVADPVTGMRTFVYNPDTALLATETLPGYFDGRVITRQYETAGIKGRNLGYTLNAGGTTEQDIDYGYDTLGRFGSVTNASYTFAFNYAYMANANLIDTVTHGGFVQDFGYELNRDHVSVLETRSGATTIARMAYQVDALGRRSDVAKTGELYSRYGSAGLDTSWGYNDRSEVTAESTKLGGTSTALVGRDGTYFYDSIGNRTTTTQSGHPTSTTYTVNSLNQYTQIERYPGLHVTGFAPASATVAINGTTAATRQGDYYAHWLGLGSASSSAWQSITVTSTLGGSVPRSVWLPGIPQINAYDDDGNLTDDSRWKYTWDAENRLASMETQLSAYSSPNLVPRQKITFRYDYLGRRVEKAVMAWNGSIYEPVSILRFVYDGWNLIAEYTYNGSSLSLARSYTWGLDISRTLADAGGVHGLLLITQAGPVTHYLPAYDGNGNLQALVNRGTGRIDAAYEYDAFGNTLRATGPYASTNPFRFSTKYTDSETGLVYYGLRYYSPSLGRFVTRDPIGEQGGLNLYGFVRNNPVNRWDYLGMEEKKSGISLMFGRIFTGIGNLFRGLWEFEEEEMAISMQNDSPQGRLPLDPGVETAAEVVVRENRVGKQFGESVLLNPNQNTFDQSMGRPSDSDNSNNAPGDLPSKVTIVPAGSEGVIINTSNTDDPIKSDAETKKTLEFLQSHSPTFNNALKTITANEGYVGIVPVAASFGGKARSNNAIYGVGLVLVQSNGNVVYPAYNLAHEIGHLYDFTTLAASSGANRDWDRRIAADPLEYYAYRFAEQVSREVLGSSGLSIGSQSTYSGDRNSILQPGPQIPLRY